MLLLLLLLFSLDVFYRFYFMDNAIKNLQFREEKKKTFFSFCFYFSLSTKCTERNDVTKIFNLWTLEAKASTLKFFYFDHHSVRWNICVKLCFSHSSILKAFLIIIFSLLFLFAFVYFLLIFFFHVNCCCCSNVAFSLSHSKFRSIRFARRPIHIFRTSKREQTRMWKDRGSFNFTSWCWFWLQ